MESHIFTPTPVLSAAEADVPADEVLQETMHRYSHRFVMLGGVIVLLLAIIGYMYQSKVGAPVADLEGDVQTEVVTQSPSAMQQVATVDAAPEFVEPAPAMIQPAGMLSASGLSDGAGIAHHVQCPSGTTRMIYIDDKALCCQGSVCSEPM